MGWIDGDGKPCADACICGQYNVEFYEDGSDLVFDSYDTGGLHFHTPWAFEDSIPDADYIAAQLMAHLAFPKEAGNWRS